MRLLTELALLRFVFSDCVPSTTFAGVAADPDTQECDPDHVDHRTMLRSDRRGAHLGEQQGQFPTRRAQLTFPSLVRVRPTVAYPLGLADLATSFVHVQVSNFELDYTECDTQGSSLSQMPSDKFSCKSTRPTRPRHCLIAPLTIAIVRIFARYVDSLARGSDGVSITAPQWSYAQDSSAASGQRQVCTIEFDVPVDLPHSVFLYYKLTN